MQNTVYSKAEQRFAAAQKKADKALSDREKARVAEAKRTAKLRDLRLAKEAADRDAAEAEAKAAAKAKAAAAKAKKPARPRKPAAAKSAE